MRATFGLLVAGCIVSLCGCGDQANPTGSVHGVVTFKGKPVHDGVVMFEDGSTGSVGAAATDEQGAYAINDLNVGEYVVTVVPPEAGVPLEISDFDGTRPAPTAKPAHPREIPKQFSYAHTSPLRHRVIEGSAEYSFDLAK